MGPYVGGMTIQLPGILVVEQGTKVLRCVRLYVRCCVRLLRILVSSCLPSYRFLVSFLALHLGCCVSFQGVLLFSCFFLSFFLVSLHMGTLCPFFLQSLLSFCFPLSPFIFPSCLLLSPFIWDCVSAFPGSLNTLFSLPLLYL